MNPSTFLRTQPSPGEALVWLAMQRAQADPLGMTFTQAVDAVLLDARCAALETWKRLGQQLEREEALAAAKARRKAGSP